jgi:long-chain acyl-CoA synthetase
MPFETTPYLVLRNGKTMGSSPAYYVKEGDSWKATDWATYAGEVRTAGKALMQLGVEVGSPVTILGFNRPEWTIMDIGAMAVGAVPAGIYTTNSPVECKYIIEHSESPVVLLENEEQWQKIEEIRGDIPTLKHIVMMKGTRIDDDQVMTWEEFMALGGQGSDEEFDARLDSLEADQVGTMIYTSGTTGPPKGVMLSYDNCIWTAKQTVATFGINSTDSALSYLPLSHIAEQSFTVHAPAAAGFPVYYAQSLEQLADNVREVQPTIFFGVPRIWERFYAAVNARLAESTGAKAKIASWAQDIGSKAMDLRNRGESPSGALAVQYALAKKLVFDKVKPALGMSNIRVAGSGAAPVAKEILEFFGGLDIQVFEVYGQSEDTGPTSTNRPGHVRFGSVGPAYPGTEVRIADDGEILVKGRHVFLGYYKDPAATADTLRDGWLHSGDLGEFDEEGFLHITGRKKDIIITAGGKNVAPKPLEQGLKNLPLVTEAVVIGDRRKYLTALVTLDDEAAEKFLADAGLTHEEPTTSNVIHDEIQVGVDILNKQFARAEQIKKFAVLPRQLSIEGGELTPTLKVKRNKVSEHFADIIEGLYEE